MVAVDPPAVVAPADPARDPDVIEIVGTRTGEALKIDRRTYRVQQNQHSAQKDAIQLLRGVPAVTITTDDQIMLLGSGNVQIFIDGRHYSGDATQYLRTLHGSDIERVEIITNPSAQYSAEGTGGIINFVLRKKQSDGISGNASGEASSLVGGQVDATAKYKKGKWTYEFQAHGKFGAGQRSSFHKRRSVEAGQGAAPTVNTEDGTGRFSQIEGDGSAKITYELDPKTSISGKLFGGSAWTVRTLAADFAGLTPDFQSFSERERNTDSAPFGIFELTFDHKGTKEGETLSAGLQLFGNPNEHGHDLEQLSDGSALSINQDNRWIFGRGQVDWEHPMGKGEILSIGGEWNYASERQDYRFENWLTDGSLGPSTFDRFSAASNTFAAYTTFQQAIGGWTVMPGIRAETNLRHVSSPGLPDVDIHRTNLFPTFHIEHPLGKTLDLTLSYSKRIDRAGPDMLRPYPAVEDVLTIVEGNPNLQDQSTDSFEANLHYHRKKIDAGVILYDRETSRLWSTNYSVMGGANFYTWVNSGRRRDSGAEFDVSMPVLLEVKVNASVNLFDERGPVASAVGAVSEDEFRYTTNATIEWDGHERGKTPGDIAQLQWMYSSPSRQFQLHDFASNWLSASYTHSFSRTTSLTGTIEYVGANRHWLLAPQVQEYYAERRPVEFKLKLLKLFGPAGG